MQLSAVLAWLFVSALLEAGGDALVRAGLRALSALRRALLFAVVRGSSLASRLRAGFCWAACSSCSAA
jgi:hypothetical protein